MYFLRLGEGEFFPNFFLNGHSDSGGGGICIYMSDQLEARATVARLAGAEAMGVGAVWSLW